MVPLDIQAIGCRGPRRPRPAERVGEGEGRVVHVGTDGDDDGWGDGALAEAEERLELPVRDARGHRRGLADVDVPVAAPRRRDDDGRGRALEGHPGRHAVGGAAGAGLEPLVGVGRLGERAELVAPCRPVAVDGPRVTGEAQCDRVHAGDGDGRLAVVLQDEPELPHIRVRDDPPCGPFDGDRCAGQRAADRQPEVAPGRVARVDRSERVVPASVDVQPEQGARCDDLGAVALEMEGAVPLECARPH